MTNKFLFNSCEKCQKGDLRYVEDEYSKYYSCFQCGWQKLLNHVPLSNEQAQSEVVRHRRVRTPRLKNNS